MFDLEPQLKNKHQLWGNAM